MLRTKLITGWEQYSVSDNPLAHQRPRILLLLRTSLAGTVSETVPARGKGSAAQVYRAFICPESGCHPSSLMRHGELVPSAPPRARPPACATRPRRHAHRLDARACGATKPTNITASRRPPARLVVTREPRHSIPFAVRARPPVISINSLPTLRSQEL